MRTLPILLACLISFLLSLSVHASPEPSASGASVSKKSISELLTKLTKVKLNKAIPVLIALEEQTGEEMLPLFKTMLKGDLYYVKKTKGLVAVSKVEGEKVYSNVFTGERLETMSKSSVRKIRVNNKLRRFLRETIARTRLKAVNPEARLKALSSLLSELDADTIKTIETLKVQETDAEVLELMDVAIAMFALTHSNDAKDRLAAVHILSGRLEGEVRNLFVKVVSQEQNLKVKAASERALASIQQRIEKFQFVDKVFFGLSLGSVLLLAAIGLAITFGVMGVINMAHGEMIMLGAYTTYVVQLMMPNAIDYSLWVAIPLAFIVSGSVGVLIERGVIRHLHGRPLETLLATFGISLILQQLVRTVFSPLNRQVQAPSWMSGSVDINPVLSLTLNRLYILAFALLVFGLLLLILNKTSLGLNVRAVSQNRNMAKAMGIKTDRVDAMTFGLGSGIAGMAGVALSQLTNVGPNLGQAYIIDSFMVVVFGGVGNLWGTLVAGFSLGLANKFIEPITGAVLASILVLVFIILFIQKRPKGLFPQKGRAAE
ncbi:MAG: urea transport system permease protein [Oleiphilaceae bacterium]